MYYIIYIVFFFLIQIQKLVNKHFFYNVNFFGETLTLGGFMYIIQRITQKHTLYQPETS